MSQQPPQSIEPPPGQNPIQQPPQYQPSPHPEKNPKRFVFWATFAIYAVNIVLLVVLILVANGRLSAGDMQGVGEVHIGLPFIKSKPEQVIDRLKETGFPVDQTRTYTKEEFAKQYSSDPNSQITLVGSVEGAAANAPKIDGSAAVLKFTEDSDYSKFKGLLQFAGAIAANADKSGKNYVFAFRDKEQMMLIMSGNFTKQDGSKYEAAFAKA
jgi:hypothetical protein